MRYSLLVLGALILASLSAAMPVAEMYEKDMDIELMSRADQPEAPWPNDDCFNPENQEEHKKVYDCPKKNALKLSEQGEWYCPVSQETECQSYCEESLSWAYGQEMPFDNSGCRAGDECTLTATDSATTIEAVQYTVGINEGTFSAGASFSWSDSKVTANGISRKKAEDAKNECGYWTFVPYMITSCGKTGRAWPRESNYNVMYNVMVFPLSPYCSENPVYKDACVTSVYKTKLGVVGGKAIFVTTDCDSNKILAFCKQDPIFLKAGVARDPQVHLDYKDSWSAGDESKGPTTTAQTQCELGNWPLKN